MDNTTIWSSGEDTMLAPPRHFQTPLTGVYFNPSVQKYIPGAVSTGWKLNQLSTPPSLNKQDSRRCVVNTQRTRRESLGAWPSNGNVVLQIREPARKFGVGSVARRLDRHQGGRISDESDVMFYNDASETCSSNGTNSTGLNRWDSSSRIFSSTMIYQNVRHTKRNRTRTVFKNVTPVRVNNCHNEIDLQCRCASLNDISMQMFCGTEMDDEDSRWDLDSFGLPDGRSQSWSLAGSSDSDNSMGEEELGERPPCEGEESPGSASHKQFNQRYYVNTTRLQRKNTYTIHTGTINRHLQNQRTSEESKINNLNHNVHKTDAILAQNGTSTTNQVKTENNRKHTPVDGIKQKKKRIVNKLKKISKQLHSKCSSQSIQLRTLAVL